MKTHAAALLLVFGLTLTVGAKSTSHKSGTLTPTHSTIKRGAYTIEIVGDTLHQASPQNTRVVIRVAGPDKKLVKPDSIALIDKSGAAINPVHREDRKVGHEENTGLPFSSDGSSVGVDLNKVFGPKGDYAYSKVDWPKETFTADKRLQLVVGGQALTIPLSSLAN